MRTKEKRKKILIGVILALMVMCMPQMFVNAATTDDTPVDFILVLDCSGTMEKTDPEQLSISAAKMFVDMLPMENARVGVVGFGGIWGDETYVYEKHPEANTYTKVAHNLSSVENEKEKNDVKAAISDISQGANDKAYSTFGYALEAGIDMLHEGKTEKNQACIVLMSDGRYHNVEDSDEAYVEKDEGVDIYKSKSMDAAMEEAKENEWPIYCLEMAFDIKDSYDTKYNNKSKGFTIPTGLYHMEHLAKETGGEKFTAFSNLEVERAFSNIFTRFYDVEPTIVEKEIKNGSATMEFTVAEMIAETNITVTGAGMSKVTAVELTDSSGNTKKYEKSEKSDSRMVIFENGKYVMLKLLQPKEGEWKVTAYGEDGVIIKLMAVPIRELNFQLNTTWDTEETVAKGGTVDFTASFIYNGISYSSDKFYKDNKAYLEIVETGEKFEMTGGTDNYTGTVIFNQSGTCTVRAFVESGFFRNDRKETGEYVFNVANLPVESIKDMEDISLKFNEKKEIDCGTFFKNPDNDKLNYKISFDKTSGMSIEASENNIMTVTAGIKAGDYEVSVSVNDGYMDQDVTTKFQVHLENQPLVEKGDSKIKKSITYNAEKIPGFIKSMFGVDEAAGTSLDVNQYFEDPDGISPVYEIKDLPGNAAISVVEKEAGVFDIQAVDKGETTFKLVAKDASDESISFEKEVVIKTINATSYVWNQIRWKVIAIVVVLIILIVLLIATFAGRKIYGVWDVTVGGRSEEEVKLGRIGVGKKSKCTLKSLLYDLDLPGCENEKIILKAGNNWNKLVTLDGLEAAEEVEYKGITYEQMEQKIKKAPIKKGQSVSLKVDGTWITLSRL